MNGDIILYLNTKIPNIGLRAHESLCKESLFEGKTTVFQKLVRSPVSYSLDEKGVTSELKEQSSPPRASYYDR